MDATSQQRVHTTDPVRLCHDLRQYVAAGRLLADAPGDPGSDQQERWAAVARVFAAMDDLITTELGGGRRSPVIDLVDVVEECVTIARMGSAATIRTDLDGPARSCADPRLMRSAVMNVLDNATRAAGAHGQVDVRILRQERENWVEIADTGPGFARIEPVTGHGLSIIDRAIRGAHGRLEISSGPGPGTTVRLRIPAQRTGSDS